jgi:guanidinopropionase
VRFSDVYHLDRAIREIEDYYQAVARAGVTPLTCGGDHSIVFPILKALSAGRQLGLVHIDAHLDTWPAFMGSTMHHGAPFRLAVEAGAIDPKRTIQIGIRGAQNITDGWDYSRTAGMRVVFMEELLELGVPGVLAEIRRIVGTGPTYVTFDIDSLDPAFAPGTGTPEVGGLSTREAQALIRGLAGLNLVGADVVEVAPAYDSSGVTALAGATLMFELLCVLAGQQSRG